MALVIVEKEGNSFLNFNVDHIRSLDPTEYVTVNFPSPAWKLSRALVFPIHIHRLSANANVAFDAGHKQEHLGI